MGFGALRNLLRPLSAILISRLSTTTPPPLPPFFTSPKSFLLGGSAFSTHPQWLPLSNHLHSLTDTRFPKRRPSDKPRRKRASMKPPGRMLGFSMYLANQFFQIDPMKGVSKEGMRKNE